MNPVDSKLTGKVAIPVLVVFVVWGYFKLKKKPDLNPEEEEHKSENKLLLKENDIIVTFNEQKIFFRLNYNIDMHLLQNKKIIIKIIRNQAEPEEIMLSSDKPEVTVKNMNKIDQFYEFRLQDEILWSPRKEITSVYYLRHLRVLEKNSDDLSKINKELLEELKSYSQTLNILMLGCISYGKSAFLNTLKSTWDGRIQTPVISTNDSKTGTRRVTKYDWYGSFGLYDCPGVEANFREEIFEELILGKVKPNVTVNQFIGDQDYPEKIADPAMWKPFDAIILTVPLKFKESDSRLERLHSFVQIAIKNNIRIILVFTKIDDVNLNRPITNQDIITEPAINLECQKNLQKNMTAFKNSSPILIKNLTSNLDEPCPYRDWLALTVLKSIKD